MGKFTNWLKKTFKSSKGSSSGGAAAPATPSTPSTPAKPLSGINRIALIVGHGQGNDKGAYGGGTNEWDYNSWVAEYVKKNLPLKEVEVFYRGATGIVGVAHKAKAFNPDLCVELHLNATEGATGCEVLVINGDKNSEQAGRSFAEFFQFVFGRRLRQDKGIKWLDGDDRGFSSLNAQKGIPRKILVEPFFIDTPAEWINKNVYAEFLVNWLSRLA